MMKKVLIKFAFIIFFMLTILPLVRHEVLASSELKVNFIFNRMSLNTNDTLTVKISLDNYHDLYSSELMIKCDNDYLMPIKVNNQYFSLPDNTIFNQKYQTDIIVFNDFIDNKYLRISLFKGHNIEKGYEQGLFNGLVEVSFVAKQPISQVSDFFSNEDFYQNNAGVRHILTDTYGQTIKYKINYHEKLKASWQVENYEIEVFAPLPNFFQDIIVSNRPEDNYQLEIMFDELNTNLIGLQVIKIRIFDLDTNESYFYARPINIIDLTPPDIMAPLTISINDIEIMDTNFLFATATDNYDPDVLIKATYFTENEETLPNLESFISYLSNNIKGIIKYNATDQSGNEALQKTTSINIIDTTPPVVLPLEDIKINDVDFESFDFDDYVQITDNYDNAPKFATYALDKNNVRYEDYHDILFKDKEVTIAYFAFDHLFNTSITYFVKVTLIDTTPPVITGIVDLELTDVLIKDYQFIQDIVVSDNFDKSIKLDVKYHLNEKNSQEVDHQTFVNQLYQGGIGYIEYQASDKAGNMSEIVFQKVNVRDTLPPVIKVSNLTNGKKYVKVEPISYEITDNSIDDIITEVYLNNDLYEPHDLTIVGLYAFKIVAIDFSGNKTELIINFEIIKDDVISCGDDISCYLQNYRTIVIIVGSILGLVMVITIIQIVNRKKKINQLANITKK